MKFQEFFLYTILITGVLLWGNPLQATSYEYSDAPEIYGTAKHSTGQWQRLGSKWDRENSPLRDNMDASDDGVFWSTDNGDTWGHDVLSAGQNVMFGFEFTRAGYGIHPWDGLSAWVDWNSDGVWSSQENIIDIQWDKGGTQINDQVYKDYFKDHGTVINPTAELSAFFTTELFTITTEMDDLWLRARVACSSSIGNAGGRITPYNTIHQGEVEDWQMTVNPVPEPGTMVLLGCGLLGVAGLGRKRFFF